jgi:hypothetical protein
VIGCHFSQEDSVTDLAAALKPAASQRCRSSCRGKEAEWSG